MTRKHFEAIAAAIAAQAASTRHYPEQERQAALDSIGGIADAIADIAEQDNPRFARGRFLKACGIYG
jgi:hypothetical protein